MLYWAPIGTANWHTQTIAAPHTTLGISGLVLVGGTTLSMATEGVDHSLQGYYTTSLTSAWRSGLVGGPGTTYSAPSIARNGKKVVDIAAQGPDGSLLFYSAHRGTATWARQNVAGANSTLAAPSVAANGSNSVVTAVGPGSIVSAYVNVNGSGTWQPARVTPRA
jgi:hypothetical protein